jgi:hypothetical protein
MRRSLCWLLAGFVAAGCVPLEGPAAPRPKRRASTTSDEPARGPSTAEERAKAVEAARRLEADPLAYGADEERARLTVWVMQIPDIYVKTCPALVAELEQGPLRSMLDAQMLLASTAFLIEHPKQAKNDLAVYTAALESALRTYTAVIKVQPESRSTFLDGLLERKRAGQLPTYVRDVASDCAAGD